MARKEELARMWQRTVDYLFNQRPAFERQGASGYKPGLETSLALDRMYNEPHRNYLIIHIAGTNGKGSVSAMLDSILRAAGYRGIYNLELESGRFWREVEPRDGFELSIDKLKRTLAELEEEGA